MRSRRRMPSCARSISPGAAAAAAACDRPRLAHVNVSSSPDLSPRGDYGVRSWQRISHRRLILRDAELAVVEPPNMEKTWCSSRYACITEVIRMISLGFPNVHKHTSVSQQIFEFFE